MVSRTGGLGSGAELADARNGARLQQDVKSKKLSLPHTLVSCELSAGMLYISAGQLYVRGICIHMYISKSVRTWLAVARAAALREAVSLLALCANGY